MPRDDDPFALEDETPRSPLLTACGRMIGSIGVLILVILVPATVLVVMGTLGLIRMPGWTGDNTSAFGFFIVVVPAGLAIAALHFLLGGLVLGRHYWPVIVAALLPLAVMTLFPLGLRISWPFLGLTLLYASTLLLTVIHHSEFE
jgi:hypothetical protein